MTPHALQGSPERCREHFPNAGDFYTKALHVPTPDCRTSSGTQKHRLQALTCNRCIFMQWRIESNVYGIGQTEVILYLLCNGV